MLSNHLILCCPLLLLPSTFPTRLPSHLSWWRICLQCRRPWFSFWAGRSTGEGIGYPPQYSWASLVAQLVKNPPAMQRPGFYPWVGQIPWRRERLPTPHSGPEEFHGLYHPWGRKELDTAERLSLTFPSIGVSSIELSLHIRWPKYWSFIISPSNDIQGWFPLRLIEYCTNCWVYSVINPLTRGSTFRMFACYT